MSKLWIAIALAALVATPAGAATDKAGRSKAPASLQALAKRAKTVASRKAFVKRYRRGKGVRGWIAKRLERRQIKGQLRAELSNLNLLAKSTKRTTLALVKVNLSKDGNKKAEHGVLIYDARKDQLMLETNDDTVPANTVLSVKNIVNLTRQTIDAIAHYSEGELKTVGGRGLPLLNHTSPSHRRLSKELNKLRAQLIARVPSAGNRIVLAGLGKRISTEKDSFLALERNGDLRILTMSRGGGGLYYDSKSVSETLSDEELNIAVKTALAAAQSPDSFGSAIQSTYYRMKAPLVDLTK
jgi:hypothetical protein